MNYRKALRSLDHPDTKGIGMVFRKHMVTAVKYYLGEYEDLTGFLNLKDQFFQGRNEAPLNLPYSTIWLEYSIKSTKAGMIVTEVLSDGDMGEGQLAINDPHLVIQPFMSFSNGPWKPANFAIKVGKIDKGLEKPSLRMLTVYSETLEPVPLDLLNAQEQEEVQQVLMVTGIVLNVFLRLLMCRNVGADDKSLRETVVNTTVKRKKRKRVKVQKTSTVTTEYKMLVIHPTKKGASSIVVGDGRRETKEHTVQGFWRNYTKDKPMFGNPKLFGLVRTNSYMRGSRSTGTIEKDYTVDGSDPQWDTVKKTQQDTDLENPDVR